MPDKKLVLIGDGWGTKEFKKMLEHYPNIEWLGYQADEVMIRYMQEAKACIFAAKEDFGIMCVEVQACGTPILALDYGGYKETVVDGETGYLFAEQTEQSIIDSVNKFEQKPLKDHKVIRQNSLRFSDTRFRKEMSYLVQKAMHEFYGGRKA